MNNEKKKNVRLMALPEEVPDIKIPCIMVSARFSMYTQTVLEPYFETDTFIVSVQHTGIHGDYEKSGKWQPS